MLWESRLIFADESQAIRRKSGPLGAEKDHAFPIRKSFVPHSGHVPWVAGAAVLECHGLRVVDVSLRPALEAIRVHQWNLPIIMMRTTPQPTADRVISKLSLRRLAHSSHGSSRGQGLVLVQSGQPHLNRVSANIQSSMSPRTERGVLVGFGPARLGAVSTPPQVLRAAQDDIAMCAYRLLDSRTRCDCLLVRYVPYTLPPYVMVDVMIRCVWWLGARWDIEAVWLERYRAARVRVTYLPV